MSSSTSSSPKLTPSTSSVSVSDTAAPAVSRKISIAFVDPPERRSSSSNAPTIQSPTPVTPASIGSSFGTPSVPPGTRTEAGRNLSKDRPRSLSSPPPPPTFIKRVGFDTFDNRDASDFSLTLRSKHKDYQYTRRTRTFLCGTDQNDYSEFALEWLIDELVDDGDEIVCLRVVEKDNKLSSDPSALQERLYRQEAMKLLNEIVDKNEEDKQISIILEFAVGKVHETIQRMINMYEPVILIVGTRGRSLGGIQGLLPGSVSKYCLQHSPVPVIVVRPSNKREKKKKKRQADPARRAYMEILERSNDPSLLNSSRPVSMFLTSPNMLGVSGATSPASVPASNASMASVAAGSAGSGGSADGRSSLEKVTEGVASIELFGGDGSSTFGAAVTGQSGEPLDSPAQGKSPDSPEDISPGTVTPSGGHRADPMEAAGKAVGQ